MKAEQPKAPRHLQEHLKVAEYLIRRIMSGELETGQRIPSLNDLSRLFKVNRNVANRALTRLENLGWISPIHGKGYFVNKQPTLVSSVISRYGRYTDTMAQIGERPNAHLLDWSLDRPTEEEQERLELATEDRVYRLEILRFVGSLPLSISTSTLPEAVVPGLELFLSRFSSLHGLLMEHYNFSPVRKFSTLESRMPLSRDAELLELTENMPIMWKQNVNLHPDGRPVELGIARIRGDRYQCIIDFEKNL